MAKEEEISENLLKVLKGLNKKETEDKISVSKIKKKLTLLTLLWMRIFLKISISAFPNLTPLKNFILTKKCEKKVNVKSNYGVHKVENAECTQLRNFLHNGRVRVKYAKFLNFTPL